MQLVDGYTVRMAAEAIGVSRARVQAMITDGALAAERAGNQWIIPRHAVFEVMSRDRHRGRPLNALAAWEAIADVNAGRRDLEWLRGNAHKLSRRAQRLVGRALPEVIDDSAMVLGIQVVHGGAQAASFHGAATRPGTEPYDLYMSTEAARMFVRRTSFTTITTAPNVILHKVNDEVWPSITFDDLKTDPVTAWLDLYESDDRGASEAWRVLELRAIAR